MNPSRFLLVVGLCLVPSVGLGAQVADAETPPHRKVQSSGCLEGSLVDAAGRPTPAPVDLRQLGSLLEGANIALIHPRGPDPFFYRDPVRLSDAEAWTSGYRLPGWAVPIPS